MHHRTRSAVHNRLLLLGRAVRVVVLVGVADAREDLNLILGEVAEAVHGGGGGAGRQQSEVLALIKLPTEAVSN